MGKLIGQMFKEDFKSIILWLLLPLLASVIFLQMLDVHQDSGILGLGIVISITLLVIGPFIALAIAGKNDNERFYSKNAAFYSALPLSSSTITGARLINFILLGIIIGISTIINYVLLMLTSEADFSVSDFFKSIRLAASEIGGSQVVAVIMLLLSVGIFLVSIIMVANSAGASNLFGRNSKSAPVLIFIILFFVLGMLSARVQSYVVNNFSYSFLSNGANQVSIADDMPASAMALPIIINLLIALILYGLSYYFHDRRLSVN